MVRVLVVLVVAGGELVVECSPASNGLSLTKRCGEKYCSLLQYCSEHGHMCKDCKEICTRDNHNYDEETCQSNCQEYIHDSRYIRGGADDNATQQFQDKIDWLSKAATSSLVISCLAALGLLSLVFYLCLRRNLNKTQTEKQMLEKKMSSVSALFNNNKAEKEKESHNLHIDMSGTVGAPSVVTTTTPISTRHPSEDTTLEYAYDNPNLTPSPQLQQPRHETTF